MTKGKPVCRTPIHLSEVILHTKPTYKGMKMWDPYRFNVDWHPRAWGLDAGPVSEYGAGFSPV